ncbi:hypothetical protein NQ315_005530 [Exocentrus adspersus]|uniref:RING-type E3 ubiquitin transferase BRCA1 n=1 Tax=Exocentrus adspersus TaxID=1586481 RepID=A0AAV8VUD1_9CUCU|nr:hypothetical protein NQ315_005530 [Exocentrus adspersus]
MNKKKLTKLVETILILKAKLKCPICLEVMQDIVELECAHKYCKTCFLQYKSTNKHPSCPLCKRTLKRRSATYTDDYGNAVGKFIYNTCEELRNVYKCEIDVLHEKLLLGIELCSDKNHGLGNVLNKSIAVAVPSSSKYVSLRPKEKSLPVVKPAKEANKRRLSDSSDNSTDTVSDKSLEKSTQPSKKNCEDAFDKLLNVSRFPIGFNKKCAKRVYSNKKKKEKKHEPDYNILEFDNDENREGVLQWLHDTRNEFDRWISQSQNNTEEVSNNIPGIGLMPVSLNKVKCDVKPVTFNVPKGRARSLDIEIKKTVHPGIRRRSRGGSFALEDYDIEEATTEEVEAVKKAEKKVLQDLIEDEFLERLENEMQVNNERGSQVKTKKYRGPKKIKPLSPTSTTGWERLTKMEKALRKDKRTPKQLNVTLQSTQETKNQIKETVLRLSNEKEDTLGTKQDEDFIPAVAIIDGSDPETKSKDIQKPSNTAVTSPEGMRKAGAVTKLLNKKPASSQTSNTDNQGQAIRTKSTEQRNDISDKKSVEVSNKVLTVVLSPADIEKNARNSASSSQNDGLNQDMKRNETIENKSRPPEDIPVPSNVLRQKRSFDLEKLEDYVANNMKFIDKNTSEDSISYTYKTEQSNKLDRGVQSPIKAVGKNPQTAKSQAEEEYIKSSDDSCVLLDVLFNTPTQKVTQDKVKIDDEIIVISDTLPEEPSFPIPGEGNRTDFQQDDIALLYGNATQKINHTFCNSMETAEEIMEKHNSVEELLHLVETCLEKCITNFKLVDVVHKPLENELNYLLLYLSKLKSAHKNGKESSIREVYDVGTQTVVGVANKVTQTEDNKIDIGLQTKDLHCIKCNIDLNKTTNDDAISQDTKTALESIITNTEADFKPVTNKNTPLPKPETQNEIFTCTLDNLNFETQDIARNKGTITKTVPKVASTQVKEKPVVQRNETTNKENIPSSVLVCSLNSSRSPVCKRVNRKLTYEAEVPKRMRDSWSDEDFEEELIPAKRKCNRFLRDDLTVEFLTHPEKADKNIRSETQNSDDINYDEYLENVLKRYEKGNSTTKSSDFKKPNGVSSQQEMIKKCEDMINNAKRDLNVIKAVTEQSVCSSKDSFRTASDSVGNTLNDDDNVFMDEGNLLKLDNDILEYEQEKRKPQNSESSDIIAESEEVEHVPKKLKTMVQKKHNHGLQSKNENKTSDCLPKNCNAFNDDFDETAFGKLIDNITEEQANLNKGTRVNIISDIKIQSQIQKNDMKEDDLFSDEDIVETTPQKKIDSFTERLVESQILNSINKINTLQAPVKETENFDYDILPLPPPPDFQDDMADMDIPSTPIKMEADDEQIQEDARKLNEDEDMELDIPLKNESKFSLTPDNLDLPQMPRVMTHSTQIYDVELQKESLGLSPIRAGNSQKIGMKEMAKAAKFTPLNIVSKQTPHKPSLLTSTPKQKSIWNYVKPSQSVQEASSSYVKPCIACSRLPKEKVKCISQLTSKKLATYNPQFDSNVTHMIVTVNERNCVKDYTIKFVSAIAAGIWVLRFDWVEECLSKNRIVPEEPFEVLDCSGVAGPRTSRLMRKQNPLFRGYKFFCAEPIVSTTKREIENILKMLGGKILRHLRGFLEDDDDIGIIIAEGHVTQDFEQYERWVEQYKTVTVDLEWLSKCVGQYKVLSIRPYIWCSEDHLNDLGYPPFLTEVVPLSFTETL